MKLKRNIAVVLALALVFVGFHAGGMTVSAAGETEAPAPSETASPAPSETEAPAPSETASPAPSETETPAPSETETPAPSETETPAPSETETPAPEETETPEPGAPTPDTGVSWELADGTLTISGNGEMGTLSGFDKDQVTRVVIEEGVTSIGSYAFSGCSSLTSVTIPDSVTSIEHNAFNGCRSLKSISLPNVTTIEYMTFANCTSLAQVEIPDSVKAIEYQAFANCASLSSVTFKGDAPELAVRSIDLSYADNDPKDYAGFIFQGVTATICYPLDNTTWTSVVKQRFGEGAHLAWARGDSSYTMDPVSIDLTYKAGSRGGLTFRCYHSLDDFVSAMVDGKVVDTSHYKVEEGSTRLVIVSEFLDNLSPGEHTLTMNYEEDYGVDVHFYIQKDSGVAGTPSTPGSSDSPNNTTDGNSTSDGKASFDYTYKTGEKTGIDNIILIICGICMMGCLVRLYMNKKYE